MKIRKSIIWKIYQVGEYWAVILALLCLIFNKMMLFTASMTIAIYFAVKVMMFSEHKTTKSFQGNEQFYN